MSQLLIHDDLGQLDLIKKVSGSQRETIVREAFKDPLKAWAHKLGSRCAIDWMLDQHKEKVVGLLQRVTTVSVETVQITEATKGVAR